MINKLKNPILNIETPTEVELRKFGVIMSIALSLLFLVVLPFLFDIKTPLSFFLVIFLLICFSFLAPKKLYYFYKIWMIFGYVLNWINTRIILGLVFFTMFFFISIILRILRKDPMNRKIDKNRLTYRESINENLDNHMERPY